MHLSVSRFVVLTLYAWLLFTFGHEAHAQRWEQVWAEEFNGPTIDTDTWTFWHGTAYNNELQFYTSRPKNAYIEDGKLHLVAHREPYGGRQYTSARIKSQYSGDWKYGRFLVRAKLPQGQGFWPAIWMMPTDAEYGGWPHSGEIDIMEFRGNDTTTTSGTLHYWRNGGHQYTGEEYHLEEGDFVNEFHVFELQWEPGELRWYVDGNHFQTLRPEDLNADPWPFSKRFYMILNLAVGGDFLKNPDQSTPFPGHLVIDYVRVEQDANKKPVVTFANPTEQDSVAAGHPLEVQITAEDPDGQVEEVDIFINDSLFATDAEAPYKAHWEDPVMGCHTASAVAHDNENGRSDTTSISFRAGHGCTRKAYGGQPVSLPGTILFSHYDSGGQQIGHYDTSPYLNRGRHLEQAFRPNEGVDLRPLPDAPDTAAVSWIDSGEWLNYRVNVSESGTYDLTAYLRRMGNNATFRLEWEGSFLTRFFRFPRTEDSLQTVSKTITGIELNRGPRSLRWISESSGYDLIKLKVEKSSSTATNSPAMLPERTVLEANYPNPFNPSTTVRFSLAASQQVHLDVFELTGRHMATIHSGRLPAGTHTRRLNAGGWSSGIYILRLTTPTTTLQRKMILLK